MKKIAFFMVATLGLFAASCSQDEPTAPINGADDAQIGFSVVAGNGSRAISDYQTGLDINKITVSAWVSPAPTQEGSDKHFVMPNYSESNLDNAAYFTNDVLVRQPNAGTFNYASGARYWPANGLVLDFFSVVDNNAWGDKGTFVFNANDGRPGLAGYIEQLNANKMPDMLYAYTSNQTLDRSKKAGQQNVSLDFNHAFAKVKVTAEVRNQNLHVVITGAEIHGIAKEGQFIFPHKEDQGGKTVDVAAQWLVGSEFKDIAVPLTPSSGDSEVVLNLDGENGVKQEFLIGGQTGANPFNDLLVIPNSYDGRNSSGKYQTYILLKGYAFNISNSENGFNPQVDSMIYGKRNDDGTFESANMIIPVEFNWLIGTVNTYNIVFDCGNGGSSSDDPNDPAFVRIGYEVEVEPWTDGENYPGLEYNKQ